MQFADTQLLDRYWLSGGGLDTLFLYLRRARTILHQLSAAYSTGDHQQMESWRQVVEYSAGLLAGGDFEEDFLSAADSMRGLALLDMAIAGIDDRQNAAAYARLEQVRELMDGRSSRRSGLGLPVQDDMELELAFLRALCVIKWRGPVEDADRLVPVAALRDSLSGDLLPRMRRHFSVTPPQEPYVDSTILELVTWTWLLLLRVLMRFDQQAAAAELEMINHLLSDFLTLKPGFYRSGITEEGTSAWFWDLEIAKLWLLDELQPNELDFLAERRMAAFLRQGSHEAAGTWMHHFLIREHALMRPRVMQA